MSARQLPHHGGDEACLGCRLLVSSLDRCRALSEAVVGSYLEAGGEPTHLIEPGLSKWLDAVVDRVHPLDDRESLLDLLAALALAYRDNWPAADPTDQRRRDRALFTALFEVWSTDGLGYIEPDRPDFAALVRALDADDLQATRRWFHQSVIVDVVRWSETAERTLVWAAQAGCVRALSALLHAHHGLWSQIAFERGVSPEHHVLLVNYVTPELRRRLQRASVFDLHLEPWLEDNLRRLVRDFKRWSRIPGWLRLQGARRRVGAGANAATR